MEKSYSKIWVLVALIISVLALSIGFAAFSTSLRISEGSDNVTITPFDNFSNSVIFETGSLNCSIEKGTATSEAAVVSVGELADNNTLWRGLSVNLQQPGDSVTCTATVKNTGEYTAYLKNIKFNAPLGCTSATSGNTYTAQICGAQGINAKATVGSHNATTTAISTNNLESIATSNNMISGASSTLTVKVAYPSTSPSADENITITIPQITLDYSSSNS